MSQNAGDIECLRGFYDPTSSSARFTTGRRPLPQVTGGRDELMGVFTQIREPWGATDVLEIAG